ncbi:Glycoside hydrolase, superfamily [Metarhizium album ARSEF 1941]|uniref:Beta-glucosidase cel3A n=1 Tax=Metarhizium album (strain ARSEF 1941) TaxID=1081103 RepID=A0A0B2WRK1_METAS|nr:Glycoside hydrolase, superfamily [Metarhizium album ARSEF 1941]KHN95610.1 Glycoside hydrolase, superfamily [Metarhizium album ARSEF 1941]
MISIKLETAFLVATLSIGVIGRPSPGESPTHKPVPGRSLQSSNLPDDYYVPSYYPAPYGGWVSDWQESYRKARRFVASMNLAEKTNITAGSGIFMGFPQLCFNDGHNGVRQADNVTVFPDGITTGATFDKQLMYQRAVAIGKEARGKGVNVWLGPTVGPIGRKPRGGRNWEGFGADPSLQAIGARETIRGVQEQGVIATIKHFVGNEQEMYRMYNPFQYGYSANIGISPPSSPCQTCLELTFSLLDDRTLHEVYMWPSAEGIHAGVGSVMIAYNAVNGTACSQHPYLINALLKDELGFQGFVQSDWLSHMSGVASAIAGLDVDMPGDTQIPLLGHSYWMYELSRSVLNGSVPMDRLNDMTTRLVAAWYKMGQDENFPETNFDTNTKKREGLLYPAAWPDTPKVVVNKFVPVQADHDGIARQVAQDAITLLKNNDTLLPLRRSQSLKIFGTGAQTNPDGANACSDRKCNKGTLGQGWGSGTVDYMYLNDPITAIKAKADDVRFYSTDSFPRKIDEPQDTDVAVVFITSDSGENTWTVEGNHGDRDASGLHAWHGGDKLVQDVASRYKNVVVVAHTVGPLILEKWIDLPSVKSVLIAHLPGQEAGRSLAEVLFGDVSPSGHLPYSITKREEDLPESVTKLIDSYNLHQPEDTYTEGLYIDYRWLNKNNIKPRYAFGHGLSYTNFTYSKAAITKVSQMSSTPPTRPPKTGILDYTQAIPEPSEAVMPDGFHKHWRYIYSWLLPSEAVDAAADRRNKYEYPDGYSTVQKSGPRAGGGQGGNPALWDVAYKLSVEVTNVGPKYSGKASVQAYVQFPENSKYETPITQLRDFEKTDTLAPGESTTVELHLTRKDLSVWDVVLQEWVIPVVDGQYTVLLGDASDSFQVSCRVDRLECITLAQGL